MFNVSASDRYWFENALTSNIKYALLSDTNIYNSKLARRNFECAGTCPTCLYSASNQWWPRWLQQATWVTVVSRVEPTVFIFVSDRFWVCVCVTPFFKFSHKSVKGYLRHLGINAHSPTRRGRRSGTRKIRAIAVIITQHGQCNQTRSRGCQIGNLVPVYCGEFITTLIRQRYMSPTPACSVRKLPIIVIWCK